MQSKQATMVPQETYEEALAEIEQLKSDQLSMVPNLNALLEEIETHKLKASQGSAEQEKLRDQCEALRAERDEQAAALSELQEKSQLIEKESQNISMITAVYLLGCKGTDYA